MELERIEIPKQGERGDESLIDLLRGRIKQSPDQTITFAAYMEACLYDPEHGYYTRKQDKIGKDGDFYTSSAIGGFMGEMLAAYVYKVIRDNGWAGQEVTLTEWGGGTGQLAEQIVRGLQQADATNRSDIRYQAVEESPYHRDIIRRRLAPYADISTVYSREEYERQVILGHHIVLSNELLDAFPVHRLRKHREEVMEVCVGWDDEIGWFREMLSPIRDERLTRYLQDEGIELAEGQTIEVNLNALTWLVYIADKLPAGSIVLSIDYGDETEELYARHRMNGTFLCYRNHTAYDRPYSFIGEQDMTAHVNFSSLMRAGSKLGLETIAYQTQKQFLIEAGILNRLQQHAGDPFSKEARANRAIRQLLLSDGMSELFKVLVQQKSG